MLVEWNDTACEIRRDPAWRGCVHELFAAQAERTPDAVALVSDGHHLSYRELNRRADQLARRLPSEVIVGLCVERSPSLLVGVLGILKAGAAYLPLDPTYPRERLAFMIEDSEARIVVGQAKGPALPSPIASSDSRIGAVEGLHRHRLLGQAVGLALELGARRVARGQKEPIA
ncbi:MAG: AMP-binding protein [bacterium]|nr:AMP-binding protein [bacterium]